MTLPFSQRFEESVRTFSFEVPLHSGIVAPYILHYGTEEQKRRWLPKLATGKLVGAIAMTEPGTGSDLQGVKSTAKRSGNGYVLNGSKTFITNGQHANLIIVVAKTDPGAGAKGVSLMVVEAEDAKGFRRGRKLNKLGLDAADMAIWMNIRSRGCTATPGCCASMPGPTRS